MRRLALLLATSVLGAGCYSSSDYGGGGYYPTGSVNLYWDFARTAPAQAGGFIYYDQSHSGTGSGSCPQSAVDTVRVIPPGGQPKDVSCLLNGVQGIAIDGVPAGVQTFRLIGYRQNLAVFDSTASVNVSAGATTSSTVTLQGVLGDLDLFAYLAYGPTPTDYTSCASAGSPNITFEIRDVALGALVDSGTVACTDPLPATVFLGTLDLDDYKVRLKGLRLSDNAVVLDSCWQDIAHFGNDTGVNGFAPTLLTQPLPTCTPFP